MIIKELSVRNFRNIESADFSFDPKVNIFTGNNAQGKTNLCEVISTALGRSFRNPKLSELLSFTDKSKEINIEMSFTFDNLKEKENIIRYTQKNNSFKLKFNDLELRTAEELYGALRYVIFVPEDLYIVKGGPDRRRDYIDFLSNMINRVHNTKLNEYNKALKQKNNILMNMNVYDKDTALMLESWNDTLSRLGVNVMCGRLKYFGLISKYASDFYSMINNSSNGENELLSMKYESTVMENNDFDISEAGLMYDTYMRRLKETAEKEIRMKYTVVGAHRDDISFFISDMPARDFASQGQIRSIAVALKLSEAKMIYEKSGDVPIIILDDVLSELDERRRSFIVNQIEYFQTFITSCNLSDIEISGKAGVWNVEKGAFRRI